MINDLLHTYLFKDLEYRKIEEISLLCERLQLMDGDVLIEENEMENLDLYVLCSGSVEIISKSSSISSSEVVISKEDKEVFGEISWITGRKRTATVRCRGEAEAIRINGREFTKYMETHPEIGFAVMHKVSHLLADRLVATDILLKQILWNSSF